VSAIEELEEIGEELVETEAVLLLDDTGQMQRQLIPLQG
jgi:hypothetical protein